MDIQEPEGDQWKNSLKVMWLTERDIGWMRKDEMKVEELKTTNRWTRISEE
jgi:hypothetical protein